MEEAKSCAWCNENFAITDGQKQLLEKMAPSFNGIKYTLPLPSLCPTCRHQRRLSIKNDSHFYARTSSLSGKRFLSIYHPGCTFPVFDSEEWHGNSWSSATYGRDFDFTRPFFPQFKELCNVVPRRNLMALNCENCEYCGQLLNCKDCYLVINAAGNERCMYLYRAINCNDCMDSLVSLHNELCYGCTDTTYCYNTRFCFSSFHCAESSFLENCRSCTNCFMCSGLRNASYCFKNKRLSPNEYFDAIARYDLGSFKGLENAQREFTEFLHSVPALFAVMERVEDTTGDNVSEAKKCENVFDGNKLEDTLNSQFVQECKDTGDVNFGFQQSLHYEGLMVGAGSSDVAFCVDTWPNVSHLFYSVFCENSHHCFGCNGVQRGAFCILNKQYTESEYNVLVPKIIEHMRSTREWGEFFPQDTLGTGYQESLAHCYYPLTESQALSRGFAWNTYEAPVPTVERVMKGEELPDHIDDVPDSISSYAIECVRSRRLFRITRREVDYYKKWRLPLPRVHPYERYVQRVQARNARRLWKRICSSCNVEIETSYSPATTRPVVCRACFERDVA